MARTRKLHPWPVRLAHWVNLLAMVGMAMSGWEIYNASPLFAFHFPAWATLGGWLGGAIAWHLAVMWLFAANGACYVTWSLASGHWRQHWFPITAGGLAEDIHQTTRLTLHHTPGRYNHIQKIMYCVVIVLAVVMVLSGLAIWKPVQLHGLLVLLGGFARARYVHFLAMSALALFIILHVVMVLIVPRTLWAMLVGDRKSE